MRVTVFIVAVSAAPVEVHAAILDADMGAAQSLQPSISDIEIG
jgi:hypothetical protein